MFLATSKYDAYILRLIRFRRWQEMFSNDTFKFSYIAVTEK